MSHATVTQSTFHVSYACTSEIGG